jgi:hypothetical protein
VVNLIVEEVDALHAELVEKVARIDTGPVDQTWGTREMYEKATVSAYVMYNDVVRMLPTHS